MAIENNDLLVLQKNGDSSIRKATVGALLSGVVVPTVNDATEDQKGILELATQDEVNAGTDDERAVTPLKLKTVIDALPDPPAPVDVYWERNGTVLSPVNDGDDINGVTKIIAGDDIRTSLDSTDRGVEINGDLGIVHVKGKDSTVTPFEVFKSGALTSVDDSSVFRVKNDGSIHLSHDKVEIDPDGTARFEGTVTAAAFEGVVVTAGANITVTDSTTVAVTANSFIPYDISSLDPLPTP